MSSYKKTQVKSVNILDMFEILISTSFNTPISAQLITFTTLPFVTPILHGLGIFVDFLKVVFVFAKYHGMVFKINIYEYI